MTDRSDKVDAQNTVTGTGKLPGAAGTGSAARGRGLLAIGEQLRRPKGRLARLVAQTDQLLRLNRVLRAYLPPHLQDHARLVSISSQGWVIQTDASSWATRLRYILPSLQRQLGDYLGTEVPPLSIRIEPASSGPGSVEQPRRLTMTTENANLIRGTAQSVSDQRLGAALLRLAERAQQQRTGRSDRS